VINEQGTHEGKFNGCKHHVGVHVRAEVKDDEVHEENLGRINNVSRLFDEVHEGVVDLGQVLSLESLVLHELAGLGLH